MMSVPEERTPLAPANGDSTAKSVRVREMFSRIARRYDLLNSLLSLGIDGVWRREAAKVALHAGAETVLDAATGTGSLALTIKRLAPATKVTAIDFAPPMLELARSKAAASGLDLDLRQGDVMALPFEDGSFDAVTIAYGLRNLSDWSAGMTELRRVLRPGGRLVILEFPPPPEGVLGSIFRFYFVSVLPRLGGWISGSRAAYDYLPSSVLAFPRPPELATLMVESGFTGVRYRLQSYGVSAIFTGEKRP